VIVPVRGDRAPTTPLPSLDYDLMQEVVSSSIADKAGFYEAINKVAKSDTPEIGQLETLRVQGNTAVAARAEWSMRWATTDVAGRRSALPCR